MERHAFTESGNTFDIRNYIRMLVIRRYILVGVFFVVASGIVAASYMMPKEYRAETVVLVESPSVQNPLADKASSQSSIQHRLRLIRQLLFNRASIDSVIKKLDLDVYVKNPLQYEALIDRIKKNLNTRVKGKNLFQISYTGDDPRTVRDVVNALASQYIEDSLKSKRSATSISADFFNTQIQYYRKKLDEAETALKEFKERNSNLSSRRADVRLARIQSYQESLMDLKLRKRELEKRKELLNDQLSGKEPLTMAIGTEEDDDSPAARLHRLEGKLSLLLLKYTENYPEVVKTRAAIEELKKVLDGDAAENKDGAAAGGDTSAINPVHLQLKNELMKIDAALATLSAREAEIQKEIAKLEVSLKDIPGEEKELIKLERDVKVYEGIYNTLISKYEETKIARELERREEPFIFKVVSPAVAPVRPAKPDRVLFIIFGLAAGLVAGVGAVFMVENYLDTSFKNVDGLRESVDIPVLAAIPTIVTEGDRRRARKRDIFVFSAATVYVIGIFCLLLMEVVRKYGLEIL